MATVQINLTVDKAAALLALLQYGSTDCVTNEIFAALDNMAEIKNEADNFNVDFSEATIFCPHYFKVSKKP